MDPTPPPLLHAQLFSDLAPSERDELSLSLSPFRVPAGSRLFRQGEAGGDAYLIGSGKVRLTVRLPGVDTLELGVLGTDEVVGELGLLDGAVRSATATAETDTEGYVMAGTAFSVMRAAMRPAAYKVLRNIATELAQRARTLTLQLGDGGGERRADMVAVRVVADGSESGPPTRPLAHEELAALPSLHAFDAEDLDRLLQVATPVEAPRATALVHQGEPAGACFLLVRGAVQPFVPRGDGMVKMPLVTPGEMVGDVALLDGQPHPVTSVTRERCTLLELDKPEFDKLLAGDDILGFKWLDVVVVALLEGVRTLNRRYTWLWAHERRAL